ncbi:MAG: serine/threonine-protein kinase [Lachnospiraceae bacterium]|nr:serine/threonine-protein kinase [Lachnospiraceae bacterium]
MSNSERGLATGTIVYGIYVIESVLGEGGFGVTYLAVKKDTGQTVALKEYYPLAYGRRTESCRLEPVPGKETDYDRGRERFVREASVLREFCYLEGIVKVWDCFEANGTAYIIMDYIDGITLKEYVSCHGGMGYDEWMDMLSPILRSLITLHKHGVIHRDISPDNLMIGMDNQLYLIDFGAAKEIEYGKTTTVLLKVGYAPPEQYLHDGEMGAWTDVYAICATIYTALCGKAPADAVARLQGNPLIPLEDQGVTLEPWQWNAIQKGMRIRAAERFQNVEELYEALTVVPRDVELPTIMDVATDDKMQEQMHRVSDRGGRHVVLRRVCIMAAFTMLVCVVAIWGMQGRNQVEAQPETATAADTATEQASEETSTEQVKICTMPDVVGMSEIEAREKIIREDSKIQITVERKNSSQMDKDLVMEQNVAADTKYNEGAIMQVVLTVSDGVEATTAVSSKTTGISKAADEQKYDVKSNKKQTEDFYLDD